MKCSKCGNVNSEIDKFCINCGEKLAEETPQSNFPGVTNQQNNMEPVTEAQQFGVPPTVNQDIVQPGQVPFAQDNNQEVPRYSEINQENIFPTTPLSEEQLVDLTNSVQQVAQNNNFTSEVNPESNNINVSPGIEAQPFNPTPELMPTPNLETVPMNEFNPMGESLNEQINQVNPIYQEFSQINNMEAPMEENYNLDFEQKKPKKTFNWKNLLSFKKPIMIVILVILVGLLALGGYFVYTRVVDNEKTLTCTGIMASGMDGTMTFAFDSEGQILKTYQLEILMPIEDTTELDLETWQRLLCDGYNEQRDINCNVAIMGEQLYLNLIFDMENVSPASADVRSFHGIDDISFTYESLKADMMLNENVVCQ